MAQISYYVGAQYKTVPNNSVVDTAPPTFVGISSLVPQSNGSLRVTWLVGSDTSLPLRYEIYVSKNPITWGLSEISEIKTTLTCDIFQNNDNQLLTSNTLYYVGVRAVDSVGNRNTNVLTLSATSIGVPLDSIYNLLVKIKQNTDLIPATL